MNRDLIVHRVGPGVTVQDRGRPGYLAFGLSRGGAADRLALAEGAALLGQNIDNAVLEMAGFGGEFEATEDMRIALTGAPMVARIDGARLLWNASHLLPAGAKLSIGSSEAGTYGYLHIGGGIAVPEVLGARSAHLAAGIGTPIQQGDRLPIGADGAPFDVGKRLEPAPRFEGGTLRLVASLQTGFFSPNQIAQFEAAEFRRDARGNRMGVRLVMDGEGFHSAAGLSVLSEIIVPGDVQVTGDGYPFVLLSECQTTGGYPRIGSVLPSDLPRIAQARPGAAIRFQFVTLDDAVQIERKERHRVLDLKSTLLPFVRTPSSLSDLLSYQLISGVTAGDEM